MPFKNFVTAPLGSSEVQHYLMEQVTISCTSSTHPAAPTPGMRIFETDTEHYLRWSSIISAWVPDPLFLHYRGTKTITGQPAGAVVLTGAMPNQSSPFGAWSGQKNGNDVNGIVVPVAGYYDVSFTVKAPAVSPGGRGFVQVTKNNDNVLTGNGARSSFGAGEDTTTATAVDMLMAAGDQLICSMYLATAGDVNVVLTARLSSVQ